MNKRRLVNKANTWARFITGEYGADSTSDFAAMEVADLQAAGMPKADAKVMFLCLHGRSTEKGGNVTESGVTTAQGSKSTDATASVSEIAATMSHGMASAAKLAMQAAMEKVATKSKVSSLPELVGVQPLVKKVQEFGREIAKLRRRVRSEVALHNVCVTRLIGGEE